LSGHHSRNVGQALLPAHYRIKIILLSLAPLAFGQNVPPVKPLEVPGRIGILGEAKITLNEVIQRVLANDKDLAISRILREESVMNLRGARGYFDPRLGFTGQDQRTVTPASSSLSGSTDGKLTNKELLADPSVSGFSPFLGGTYKLDFSSARQTSDSTFLTINPVFPTSLNLNLTQPLWRGLLFDDNRHRIEVAKKNIQLTDAQLRQRVTEVLTQAVQYYDELDYAYRNLGVQLEAVRLAEQQDASNRRQVDQGLLAPVDVVQTQTQIATFQQNVFLAQNTLTNAENALKSIMVADRNDLMWGMALIPQREVEPRSELPSLDAALKEALAARPEIQEATIVADVNRLDTRLSKEQAKPQIDAFATLGLAGLAGHVIPPSAANPFSGAFAPLVNQLNALSTEAGLAPLGPVSFGSAAVPPVLTGGYGQSLGALGSGQFTTAVVGVNITLPVRNRTALAAEEVSLAEGRRLAAQKQQVELAVQQDVRNALQTMSSVAARLDAAATAQRYAEEQYRSEQRQFQAGTSTVFLVLQRQTDLITARTREVRAEADMGEAKANLDRALSRTLMTFDIRMK
jgi:outer membrane protein TolC